MDRLSGWAHQVGGGGRATLSAAVTYLKSVAALPSASRGALDAAGLSAVAPNLYLLRLPAAAATRDATLHAAAELLRSKHGAGAFMVYNVGGGDDSRSRGGAVYDTSVFDQQVVEVREASSAHPALPLDAVFALCTAMDAWLRADAAHVAVVHGSTGGVLRATFALAAYLCFVGGGAVSPRAVLGRLADTADTAAVLMLQPSQRRYLDYCARVLASDFPRTKPLMLDRIIVNTIPTFGDSDGGQRGRFRPVLQIYQRSKNVFMAPTSMDALVWYEQDDLSIIMPVGRVLDGDIIVRIRHYPADGTPFTVLRLALHIGFVHTPIERVAKAHIDGACTSARFHDDFLLDFQFSPALDENGDELPSVVSPDYWQKISHREEKTPTAKTALNKFALFEGDDDDDNNDVAEAVAESDDEKDSDSPEQLDAYAKGLDHIDLSGVSVDSDTDDLLAELQREIEESAAAAAAANGGGGKGSEGTDSPSTGDHDNTELDAEINRLLAEEDDA